MTKIIMIKDLPLALVAILFSFFSFSSFATCQVDHFEFSVSISEMTFDRSYDYDDLDIALSDGDFAQVKDLKTGEITIFDLGTFSNDGAGNFEFKAISSEEATYFEVFHDHEAWEEGLEGYFTKSDGVIIDFDPIKNCSFDKLFN